MSAITTYNVLAADAEVAAMMTAADTRLTLVERIAYTLQAILTACDKKHRAVFLLRPHRWHVLHAKFKEAVDALDDAVKSRTIDWIVYQTYADLAQLAQSRLVEEFADNVETVLTCYKDGKIYSAEVTCDGEILSAVAAGFAIPDEKTELYQSVSEWLEAYGLDESGLVVSCMDDSADDVDSLYTPRSSPVTIST